MHDKQIDTSRETDQDPSIRFPPWLITYSDLITLLLTFFVLLMSMADLDPVRFNAASNSLKGAFGIRPLQTDIPSATPGSHSLPDIQADSFAAHIINSLHKRLTHDIEELGQEHRVTLTRTGPDTILVRIQEALLFDPGNAQLRSKSIALLDRIASGIDDHPIALIAEGHCDFFETGAGSEKNWELSTARAVSVLRYFVENKLLSPNRLSASGYGATQPLSTGTNPSERLLNRRVDIILRAHVLSGTGSADANRSGVPL